MRAQVLLFSIAILLAAAPAQAANVDGAAQATAWSGGALCAPDASAAGGSCSAEACILLNEEFPSFPDELLPVDVNVSQCTEGIIKVVEELLPTP